MNTITRLETFETTDCIRCSVLFAMTTEMMASRRRDGGTFYCPNGHGQCFSVTEEARLRRQLEEAKRRQELAESRETHQRDQREAAERSNRALRGVVTRTKKRAAAGVCQCCDLTFPDVAEHMASQHPEFTAKALEEAK